MALYPYTRQRQAADRVALRRWLRVRKIAPVMGNEPNHTELLMKQVHAAGGDPHALMLEAQANIDTAECAYHGLTGS